MIQTHGIGAQGQILPSAMDLSNLKIQRERQMAQALLEQRQLNPAAYPGGIPNQIAAAQQQHTQQQQQAAAAVQAAQQQAQQRAVQQQQQAQQMQQQIQPHLQIPSMGVSLLLFIVCDWLNTNLFFDPISLYHQTFKHKLRLRQELVKHKFKLRLKHRQLHNFNNINNRRRHNNRLKLKLRHRQELKLNKEH